MKTLLALLALFSLAASDQSPQEIYYQELIEWVFEPCMEVAQALDVKDMDEKTMNLYKEQGVTRTVGASLMLAIRERELRALAERLSSGTARTWDERKLLYPGLLRTCLGLF